MIHHIKDYDEGLTLGAGFNLGQALSKDKDNPFSNKYRLTFGGKDGEGYTKATIGKGSLKCVEDGVCQSGDANRNLDSIQDLSYKYDVDTINIVFINPQDVKEKSEKAWNNLKDGQFVKDASKSFEEAVGIIRSVFGEAAKQEVAEEIAEEVIAEEESTVKADEKQKDGGQYENNSEEASSKSHESPLEEKAKAEDASKVKPEPKSEQVDDRPDTQSDKDSVKKKPTIELVARDSVAGKKHSFTIFTDSEGRKTIITGFPENKNPVTGNLEVIDVPYTKENAKLLGDDWVDKGKYKQYTIIKTVELKNDQELQSHIHKAREAIKAVEIGNNGGRFDYDICTTDNCWGGNSNTLQKHIYDSMGLKIEVPKGMSLPGINGEFYDGPFDDFTRKIQKEMERDRSGGGV